MKAADPPIADALAGARGTRIKVGIGGWNFAPWRNNFYPDNLPQRRELEYASRHLAAIEINSTFYRAPPPDVYAQWRDTTPDEFMFSLKAPRYIVQRRQLATAGNAIRSFIFGGLAELGDRLGPVVWQFRPPRTFARDDMAAFLDLLPPELDGLPLRHVLEVRDASFHCQEFVSLARAHAMPCVFTDAIDAPSFADLTGDFVYARLKRSRAELPTGYATTELDAWARRASLWASGGEPGDLPRVVPRSTTRRRGARDVFIYFIASAKARNPAAAMALQGRIA